VIVEHFNAVRLRPRLRSLRQLALPPAA